MRPSPAVSAVHRWPSFRAAALLSALTIVIAGLLAFLAVRAQDETAGWVTHTHEVIEQVERAGAALTSAETAQRAFLLTGDRRQLDVIGRHKQEAQAAVLQIASLTRDNARQQQRIASLRAAVDERLRSLDAVLERWMRGDRAAAIDLVRSRGIAQSDRVKRLLQAMREEEDRLLESRLETAERAARLGGGATVATSVLALALLYALYSLSVAHSRRLAAEQDELRRSREETRRSAEALRLANDELKRAADELEQRVQQRTRALAEANVELEGFARTVAHDLRAPLRNIQGYASALAEDESPRMSEDGREYTLRLIGSAQRLDGLITDLLEYSRLARTELRVEPVALDDVVSRALEDLEQDIQLGGAAVHVERPLPDVMGHGSTLQQVLNNLLSNALKFVQPGGAARVTVSAERDGDDVVLSVSDEGIGIDHEHHERIFAVFERLHGQESYPGTGIGLAIVKKGVERMGGRITVTSEPDKGARFNVRLPATRS